MSISHVYLGLAIACEVLATSSLKATEEFSRFWPSLVVVVGYPLSFWFLTLSLRTLPIGMAYAIWAGCGVVLVAVLGVVFYAQPIDWPGAVGIGLIVVGVVTLNLFSKMSLH